MKRKRKNSFLFFGSIEAARRLLVYYEHLYCVLQNFDDQYVLPSKFVLRTMSDTIERIAYLRKYIISSN